MMHAGFPRFAEPMLGRIRFDPGRVRSPDPGDRTSVADRRAWVGVTFGSGR